MNLSYFVRYLIGKNNIVGKISGLFKHRLIKRHVYRCANEDKPIAKYCDYSFNSECIAVVIHSFYPDVLLLIIERFKHICNGYNIKLYVTSPDFVANENLGILERSGFDFEFLCCENKGRDILPFFRIYPKVAACRHRFILKLHTKKSKHRSDGDRWRDDLYNKLININALHLASKYFFSHVSKIGVIAPFGHILPINLYIGANKDTILDLSSHMCIGIEDVMNMSFVAGSMMFVRTASLEMLYTLINEDDFQEEQGQIDGTYAHAIERLFIAPIYVYGMSVMDTCGNTIFDAGNYEFAKRSS